MCCRDPKYQESWIARGHPDPIPRHLERAEAVARFRLTTEHDFLEVYLHWLGLTADEACPLCGHAKKDTVYLLHCTDLDEYPADGGSVSNGQKAKHGS
ncbi:reverse transcriptase [Trichonephila clavipes]|nr:reverse transcriptase [Trichonephila clavipes]